MPETSVFGFSKLYHKKGIGTQSANLASDNFQKSKGRIMN
jgi:hypothetical protein